MIYRYNAAEFVFPGHPDKLSDAIADALVQEAGKRERRALVGVEVAVHRASVFVTGRIGCKDAETIEIESIVRRVYREVGHDETWRPAPEELEIRTDLCLGPLEDGEASHREISDDQSVCVGYAVANPETNYLPIEQFVVNRCGRRLMKLRIEKPELKLGPDGKIALGLVEDDGWRVATVGASIQQEANADTIALHRSVRSTLSDELSACSQAISGLSPDVPENLTINGAGDFSVGGPEGDNGLSGKKLVVDAYGPRVPIGGGALSGKDLFKADRAGALIARRIAKCVVTTGRTKECRVHVLLHPGDERARIVSILDEKDVLIDPEPWTEMVDLTLAGSGDAWTNKTDLVDVARFGHFTDSRLPWERLKLVN